MAWPKTGTVSVVNGSAIVTGTGTSFFGSAQAGWGFVGPDGRVYEVLEVNSGTVLTITPVYQGATAAGQIYALFPTMSLAHDLVASVQALTGTFQAIADGPGQGKFSTDVVKLGDEDTGLGWPSSNEVALKAGGDWQLRLKDGQASGAAVQSSATDSAAGKLLLAGAFGLGANSTSAPPSNDISDGIPSGFYTTDADTTGTGSETPVNGPLLHVQRGGGTGSPGAFQIWQRGVGNLLYRRFASGVPTDWAEFFTSANILGTVSQSGGIPTGAVIERGSNANGEYVRLADGTQICTIAITADSGADSVWTFPAAFSTTTNLAVHVTARSSANAIIGGARAPSVSAVSWNAHNTAGGRTATPCSLRAEGRWY
ncbi:hypothetical protein [Leisingera sp. F5]|uniref:hypothetical protein n=1 Tax=Leisingera sp. F5 TaxID=1813816 RepID=UPI000A41DFF0|nr:hypothetical protein [Leisingera sp. F5]